MVTITLHCPHRRREALVRNGRVQGGKQQYLCRACHRHSREDPAPHAYPEERREEILCAYQERSSLWVLERTYCAFRVRRSWLGSKKVARLPPLNETLRAPDPADPASMTLELDELWSFVAHELRNVYDFLYGLPSS